jgi:hypothetical protein
VVPLSVYLQEVDVLKNGLLVEVVGRLNVNEPILDTPFQVELHRFIPGIKVAACVLHDHDGHWAEHFSFECEYSVDPSQ